MEQNNKLVEAIQFASDSYWGDPQRYKFRARVSSISTQTLIESGDDRAAKSTFTLTLHGYIIPDTINKYMATDLHKLYSKSQVVVGFETVDGIDTNETPKLIKRKSFMGASTYVDSYNINSVSSIPLSTLMYLNVNIPVKATTIGTDTAVFPKGMLSAPDGFPPTSALNFTFFVNGQLIENDGIVSFVDNGNDTCTLTINTTEVGFSLESSDEIIAIGKFKN